MMDRKTVVKERRSGVFPEVLTRGVMGFEWYFVTCHLWRRLIDHRCASVTNSASVAG
jgi:hypothetical protein